MTETFEWKGSVKIGGTILFYPTGGSTLFTDHAPKSDGVKAVKLTAENIHEVGKYIAEKIGVDVVEIDVKRGRLACEHPEGRSFTALVGSWIVEKYNYHKERVEFYRPTSDEREKYDLR